MNEKAIRLVLSMVDYWMTRYYGRTDTFPLKERLDQAITEAMEFMGGSAREIVYQWRLDPDHDADHTNRYSRVLFVQPSINIAIYRLRFGITQESTPYAQLFCGIMGEWKEIELPF